VDDARARLTGATVERVAQHHRRRPGQQRNPQSDLDVPLRGGHVPHQVEQVGAQEGGGDRAEHHPPDEPEVHGACAQVHKRPQRAHHHRRDEVAGDRRRRSHPEQQDQHRRHERTATGAGHPDEQPDDRAAQNDVGIDVHSRRRAYRAAG
jgi:hypothetical protein